MLPKLSQMKQKKITIDTFTGYCHKDTVPAGAFYDMKNMTCDDYPVLSTRERRLVPISPQKEGEIFADGKQLYYIENDVFDGKGLQIALPLKGVERQTTIIGNYIFIFPDKVYINTLTKEMKKLEYNLTCEKGTKLFLYKVPFDYKLDTMMGREDWLDTGTTKPINGGFVRKKGDLGINGVLKDGREETRLYQCTEIKSYGDDGLYLSEPISYWTEITNTYLLVTLESASGEGLSINVNKGDYITIDGFPEPYTALDGIHKVVNVLRDNEGVNHIVIDGEIPYDFYGYIKSYEDQKGDVDPECEGLTIRQSVPDLDFVVSHQNRLWGCNSEKNEIYCCALGDYANWYNYEDASTASYAASIGINGEFTGIGVYEDSVIFFKENAMIRLFGTRPQNFTIKIEECRGVEKYSEKSIQVIDNRLFYKSSHGICVYGGGVVNDVSDSLRGRFTSAVSGQYKHKYYTCMVNSRGKPELYVYDTLKGLWSKEDDYIVITSFASCMGGLYFISDNQAYGISASDRNQLYGISEAIEEDFDWFAETGDLYGTDLNHKFISKLQVSMEVNGTASVSFQQDTGRWEPVYRTVTTEKKVVSVPLIPKRCNTLRVRFEGTGDFKLYAMAMTIEEGSELYG